MIFSNQLYDYSRVAYVNTIDDSTEIKNSEKLLVFIFSKKVENYYNNLWHTIRVCNVVKDGPTTFYSYDEFKRVFADSIYYTNGKIDKYIDRSKYLSCDNEIIEEEPLSEVLQKFIGRNLVYFTVRIPSNKLLEEIREHKHILSLKLLSIVSICTIDLPKYNKIIRDCILSLGSKGGTKVPLILREGVQGNRRFPE